MTHELQFGHFSIRLPDESINTFTIFENLADIFGLTYQSEAVKKMESKLKTLHLKPKPRIDYEGDYTEISSKSADTIIAVAQCINSLAIPDRHTQLSESDVSTIYSQLQAWKRPTRQRWKIGDIFSIPLHDGSYAFGQVVGTHLAGRAPVCALFEMKKSSTGIIGKEFHTARIISVQNTDGSHLRDHTFSIVGTHAVMVDPKQAQAGHSTADDSLTQLANAFYGLEPWNVLYREDYYDMQLLEGVQRPDTIIWLNPSERVRYRKEHFHIDEDSPLTQ